MSSLLGCKFNSIFSHSSHVFSHSSHEHLLEKSAYLWRCLFSLGKHPGDIPSFWIIFKRQNWWVDFFCARMKERAWFTHCYIVVGPDRLDYGFCALKSKFGDFKHNATWWERPIWFLSSRLIWIRKYWGGISTSRILLQVFLEVIHFSLSVD